MSCTFASISKVFSMIKKNGVTLGFLVVVWGVGLFKKIMVK
jgi:hypothetical protein